MNLLKNYRLAIKRKNLKVAHIGDTQIPLQIHLFNNKTIKLLTYYLNVRVENINSSYKLLNINKSFTFKENFRQFFTFLHSTLEIQTKNLLMLQKI